MSGDDLMFLDMQTLLELKGEKPDAPAESLQTETVPDLGQLVEHPTEVAEANPAEEQTQLQEMTSLPRTFTLSEASDDPSWTIPKSHYSGAGVYSMPVRVSGDGEFVRGRDYQAWYDPNDRPREIETSEFDLEEVERAVRRRRGEEDE